MSTLALKNIPNAVVENVKSAIMTPKPDMAGTSSTLLATSTDDLADLSSPAGSKAASPVGQRVVSTSLGFKTTFPGRRTQSDSNRRLTGDEWSVSAEQRSRGEEIEVDEDDEDDDEESSVDPDRHRRNSSTFSRLSQQLSSGSRRRDRSSSLERDRSSPSESKRRKSDDKGKGKASPRRSTGSRREERIQTWDLED